MAASVASQRAQGEVRSANDRITFPFELRSLRHLFLSILVLAFGVRLP